MDVSARRARAAIAVAGTNAASAAMRTLLQAELEGVRSVAHERELDGCDMLVFLVDDDDAVDETATFGLAAGARSRGILVAALLVQTQPSLGTSPLLAALREAADMLLIVHDPADLVAVVAALR